MIVQRSPTRFVSSGSQWRTKQARQDKRYDQTHFKERPVQAHFVFDSNKHKVIKLELSVSCKQSNNIHDWM